MPAAVMVVPVSWHEVGSRIEEDGPSLPSAFIWLSDSTAIGICGADETVSAGGVPVTWPVVAVLGTGVVAAGREAGRPAGSQPATSRVPKTAAAATAARLVIERMLAIFGRRSEIVMGRASRMGKVSRERSHPGQH
jgi:hypothetical protein